MFNILLNVLRAEILKILPVCTAITDTIQHSTACTYVYRTCCCYTPCPQTVTLLTMYNRNVTSERIQIQFRTIASHQISEETTDFKQEMTFRSGVFNF